MNSDNSQKIFVRYETINDAKNEHPGVNQKLTDFPQDKILSFIEINIK